MHRIALSELSKSGDRPQRDEVVHKLNRLADLRAALDLTRMNYDAKRSEILKSVQAELDALEAEFQPLLEAAQDNAAALETEIKNDVLLTGQSVTSDVYQAVYMKGRVSWDNDGNSTPFAAYLRGAAADSGAIQQENHLLVCGAEVNWGGDATARRAAAHDAEETGKQNTWCGCKVSAHDSPRRI